MHKVDVPLHHEQHRRLQSALHAYEPRALPRQPVDLARLHLGATGEEYGKQFRTIGRRTQALGALVALLRLPLVHGEVALGADGLVGGLDVTVDGPERE